jgi:hypothetical protein
LHTKNVFFCSLVKGCWNCQLSELAHTQFHNKNVHIRNRRALNEGKSVKMNFTNRESFSLCVHSTNSISLPKGMAAEWTEK